MTDPTVEAILSKAYEIGGIPKPEKMSESRYNAINEIINTHLGPAEKKRASKEGNGPRKFIPISDNGAMGASEILLLKALYVSPFHGLKKPSVAAGVKVGSAHNAMSSLVRRGYVDFSVGTQMNDYKITGVGIKAARRAKLAECYYEECNVIVGEDNKTGFCKIHNQKNLRPWANMPEKSND